MVDLPYVEGIKTPGLVRRLDDYLEANCSPNGFRTRGDTWRMWIIYINQGIFAFLVLLIGYSIQNELSVSLGSIYDAAEIIRYIGTSSALFVSLVGCFAAYQRKKYLLMVTVIFNAIAFVFCFLAWTIDASNASKLTGRVKMNETVQSKEGLDVTLEDSKARAQVSAIFGVIGWLITILSTYLSYAFCQELGSSGGKAPRPKSEVVASPAQPDPVSSPSPIPSIGREISSPTLNAQPQPIQGKVVNRDSLHTTSKPTPKQRNYVAQNETHQCPSCKSEWPLDVKFCGECGTNIPEMEEAPVETPVKSGKEEVWEEHFTSDGFMFYYNPHTGESKWAEA